MELLKISLEFDEILMGLVTISHTYLRPKHFRRFQQPGVRTDTPDTAPQISKPDSQKVLPGNGGWAGVGRGLGGHFGTKCPNPGFEGSPQQQKQN